MDELPGRDRPDPVNGRVGLRADGIERRRRDFPYPIYSKWFNEYAKVDPSVRFNYQSIGSGGGIKQITEQTVDFGASDVPMTDEQLKAAPGNILHIPTVMGAVVVTYNVAGCSHGPQAHAGGVAGIYLGKITKWNDPAIAEANPA